MYSDYTYNYECHLFHGEEWWSKALDVTVHLAKEYREVGQELLPADRKHVLRSGLSVSGHLPRRIRQIRKNK